MLLLILFIVLIVSLIKFLFPRGERHIINVFFGVPGSGKTTYAAYITNKCNKESRVIKWCKKHPRDSTARKLYHSKLFKRQIPVYSNVPITGAYELDLKRDIGVHHIENSKIIIDEAGVEYNNRNFKNLPPEQIYFFKYHRHYKTSIDVFSQSYDDMDITIRRLAQNFYVVKKSLLPYCIKCKRIKRSVGVDEKHQICDMYDFDIPIITTKLVFCPPLWKYFNSYSRKELEKYEFKKW